MIEWVHQGITRYVHPSPPLHIPPSALQLTPVPFHRWPTVLIFQLLTSNFQPRIKHPPSQPLASNVHSPPSCLLPSTPHPSPFTLDPSPSALHSASPPPSSTSSRIHPKLVSRRIRPNTTSATAHTLTRGKLTLITAGLPISASGECTEAVSPCGGCVFV